MNIDRFEKELEALINRHSIENGSNTPDFILAEYLMDCLRSWNHLVMKRERWYGREATEIDAELEARIEREP